MHPMQASSRWDPTRGDLRSRLHARATDFSLREWGTGIRFLISTSPRGLRRPSKPAGDIGDKLGSGMPAANADGPNLQRTIPSVRPFENGLRSVGSSATRPNNNVSSRAHACAFVRRSRTTTRRRTELHFSQHCFFATRFVFWFVLII